MLDANGKVHGLHETGQPDTPVECLVDILGRALRTEDSKDVKLLIEKAYKIAEGLDPYLSAISTPPSKVGAKL
jgi:hypothetical protein